MSNVIQNNLQIYIMWYSSRISIRTFIAFVLLFMFFYNVSNMLAFTFADDVTILITTHRGTKLLSAQVYMEFFKIVFVYTN